MWQTVAKSSEARRLLIAERRRLHAQAIQTMDRAPSRQTHATEDDPRVRFVVVPGTNEGEAALLVRSSGSSTLIVNDLIRNLNDRPGIGGWVLAALGFTGEQPHIPPVIRLLDVKDRQALARQLEAWAHKSDLDRIWPPNEQRRLLRARACRFRAGSLAPMRAEDRPDCLAAAESL